jgi:Protein of unknown function (DUF732)
MKLCCFVAVGLVFAIGAAPTAAADASSFISDLYGRGVVFEQQSNALDYGNLVCVALAKGRSVHDITIAIQASSDLTFQQTATLEAVAVNNLCPDTAPLVRAQA